MHAALAADARLLGAAEGVRRSRRNQLLIQVMPTSMRAAMRWARARLVVQMVVDRP
jgi:hypothetical protein